MQVRVGQEFISILRTLRRRRFQVRVRHSWRLHTHQHGARACSAVSWLMGVRVPCQRAVGARCGPHPGSRYNGGMNILSHPGSLPSATLACVAWLWGACSLEETRPADAGIPAGSSGKQFGRRRFWPGVQWRCAAGWWDLPQHRFTWHPGHWHLLRLL